MNASAIKDLYARKASAMKRRPALARGSGRTRIRLGDGFLCDVEHDDGSFCVDHPPSDGGGGRGAHPGQLMRASLGACLAMGYRLWGAREDVPIDAVEVEITCEYDARGRMGVSADVAIGWQRILIDVVVTSPAAKEAVLAVVAIADRLNPMLANLAPSVERLHRLTIVPKDPPGANRRTTERGVPSQVTPPEMHAQIKPDTGPDTEPEAKSDTERKRP